MTSSTRRENFSSATVFAAESDVVFNAIQRKIRFWRQFYPAAFEKSLDGYRPLSFLRSLAAAWRSLSFNSFISF